MGMWTLVLGGARSGKSGFAQRLAAAAQDGMEVVYLASGVATDEEMRRRIERHRSQRPAGWRTVEEPLRVAAVLADLGRQRRLVLWDCVTFFLGNRLHEWESSGKKPPLPELEEAVMTEMKAIAALKRGSSADLVLVSNDVGGGIVPDNEQGRFYRDVAGRVNQLLAQTSDAVYLLTAGIPVKIK